MSTDEADALSAAVHHREAIQVRALPSKVAIDVRDRSFVFERHDRDSHYLLGHNQLITHGYLLVEERVAFGSDGIHVQRLDEKAARAKGEEESEDDWQKQVDVLRCFEHDHCQGER